MSSFGLIKKILKCIIFIYLYNPSFLAGLVRPEIECTLHFALTKQPTNQLKPVQQSRQQALRAYCPNIHTVWQQATYASQLLKSYFAEIDVVNHAVYSSLWHLLAIFVYQNLKGGGLSNPPSSPLHEKIIEEQYTKGV